MSLVMPNTQLIRRIIVLLVVVLGSVPAQILAGETTNKFGISMIDIPAGSFMMGSCVLTNAMKEENKKRAFLRQPLLKGDCKTIDHDARDNEAPQHRVDIPSFQMGKTEVTLGQFKQFIVSSGRSDLATDNFIKFNSGPISGGDSAPVTAVTWYAVQAFIDWLNKTDGGGWRLPSEAEWEYACNAGQHYKYCGGNRINEVAWYAENSDDRLHVVASKKSNSFGLYDMTGNAEEMVQDCWHENYVNAPDDGSAWVNSCGDAKDTYMVRGGTFAHDAYNNRAVARSNFGGHYDWDNTTIGFRLARTR